MSMIKEIREKLAKEKLGAYVVTHGNRYIGQDILPEEHKLTKLCGFTGSAGIAVVTMDKAYLLVDGRYELQAGQETKYEEITVKLVDDTHDEVIMREIHQNDVDVLYAITQFQNVCELLKAEGIKSVGYDAWCHTVTEMEFIKRYYHDINFFDVGDWLGENAKHVVKVLERDIKFSGLSRKEKISAVQDMLKEQKADYCLFTSADSVSWLINIYARELPFSPVVRAYALVDKDGEFILFSDNLDTDLPHGNWQDFNDKMQHLGAVKLVYDVCRVPEKIKNLFGKDTALIEDHDICQFLKAEKNPVELQGMINCHIRDGAALSKFLCWLEENFENKSETDIVRKLHEFRVSQKYFFSESFGTIAGFAENGAIVHYQPSEKTAGKLRAGSLLLIDSGGQYLDGTTDVTRTVVLGKPSTDMIRDFTLVLKAHIALATARFPQDTSGMKLDTLARSELWRNGSDYKHGTGHGVACFGNVHEGPISISVRRSAYGFKANMITSDEPGIYKENRYGIRIESLLYTTESRFAEFLEFKTLTKVPIDKRLIDKYMLDIGEQTWLNNYHKEVFDCLAPYMNEKEKIWLKDACSPL